MAREQPSVSCVCSEAGEGRPAPPKESRDLGKWEKGGVPCGKAKDLSGEKRVATKQLSSGERERQRECVCERGGGVRGLLEQCPFSCRCNG